MPLHLMGVTMPQGRYWQELYDLKSHSYYIEEYLNRTEHLNRLVNMWLAIASSSSIGAWVIWRDYGVVWGFIIAASQVINAIKPFLPYRARLGALSGLSHDLEELFIQTEMRWFEVSQGLLAPEEINKLQYDTRLKKHKVYKKHLGDLALPEKESYLRIAEKNAAQHFRNYYKEADDGRS
jgi:hypothetical protein